MKLSAKTLRQMAIAGVVVSAAVGTKLAVDRYRETEIEISASDIEEPSAIERRTLSDVYYEANDSIRRWGVKMGILPPPPPCGICGLG